MKKKSPSLTSRQRIVRAVQGLRKTPQGGLILDEQSLYEDLYAEAKPSVPKVSKERKTA